MTNLRNSVIIHANIDSYKVYGNIIVGHVSSEGLAPDEAAYSIPGYFIVNVENDAIKDGLDKKTWVNLLRKHGITEELHLHKPSRFDEILGRND